MFRSALLFGSLTQRRCALERKRCCEVNDGSHGLLLYGTWYITPKACRCRIQVSQEFLLQPRTFGRVHGSDALDADEAENLAISLQLANNADFKAKHIASLCLLHLGWMR